MNGGTSTVTFTGNACSMIGSSAKNFYNLQINLGASVTHNSGGGNIHIANSFINSGILSEGPSYTFFFDQAGSAETMSGSGATTFGNLTIGVAGFGSPTSLNTGSSNFTISGSHLQFDHSGSAFTSSGTVTFALTASGIDSVRNSSSVNGTSASFANVQVSTPLSTLKTSIDFGSTISTINTGLTINKNGSIINNAPVYGSAATLIYNTSLTPYNTGLEWSGTSAIPGAGVPKNVTIQNFDQVVLGGNRTISGSLTFNSSANTLTLNGNTLTLNGPYVGTGTITGNATSALTIGSNAGTVYFTPGGFTNVLQNLVINSAGSTALGDTLYLTAGTQPGSTYMQRISEYFWLFGIEIRCKWHCEYRSFQRYHKG